MGPFVRFLLDKKDKSGLYNFSELDILTQIIQNFKFNN